MSPCPFLPSPLAALVLLTAGWASDCAPVMADDLATAYDQQVADYAQKLARLADQCDADQAATLAQRIRQWLPERDPSKITVFLPDPPTAEKAAADPSSLQQQFHRLRVEQAELLFHLAQRAVAAHDASLAVRLVGETLREDPAHEAARKILVATPVIRFHEDRRGGWRIETEHFELTTDHDRKTGAQLAEQLEQVYRVWWQLFAGYHLDDAQLARMFRSGARRRSTRRHKVVYFRDRDTYRTALKKMQPGIEQTLGIYFADMRTSFFFSGDDQDPGTLVHEITHQLFQEIKPTKKIVALRDNFWIVEGIACYMESLQIERDVATVGGWDTGRVPAARVRLLEDGFYVPFAEIVTYSSAQVQRDPRIRTLYSQAAGQTAFLMHFDGGRYRSALNDYLQSVYRGTARPRTLERATGVDYERLDAEYRKFLQTPANPERRRARR